MNETKHLPQFLVEAPRLLGLHTNLRPGCAPIIFWVWQLPDGRWFPQPYLFARN